MDARLYKEGLLIIFKPLNSGNYGDCVVAFGSGKPNNATRRPTVMIKYFKILRRQ